MQYREVTSVSGAFAPDGEVDVALLGRLLHQLHHQLVRLAHHRCAVHADELVARPQPTVLIRRSVLYDVPDVDLYVIFEDFVDGLVDYLHLLLQEIPYTFIDWTGL